MIRITSLILLSAAAASASVTAYNIAAGQTGNQGFGGSLGMDFNVVSAPGITVDRIGVFDANSDGLANALNAYIYDRSTGLPVPGSATDVASELAPGPRSNGGRRHHPWLRTVRRNENPGGASMRSRTGYLP